MHLLEFTVENYRSIRQSATLSLLSTALHDKDAHFSIPTAKKKVLNTAVLYGANASGKSNLLRALFIYRNCVSSEGSLFGNETIEPFLLDESSKTKNSVFESVFEYKNRLFMYGFSVSAKDQVVTGEWLKVSRPGKSRLNLIFERKHTTVSITKNMAVTEHGISRSLRNQLQAKELFLSTVAKTSAKTMAHEAAQAWKDCHVINTLVHDPLQAVAQTLYENPDMKTVLLPLLQQADFGITDVKVLLNDSGVYDIRFEHTYVTKNSSKNVWFDLGEQESMGTIKFFSFALPLLLSLTNGTMLILDELGSTLHPDLLRFIVRLFNDGAQNRKHAQLIITTHDTTLLKDMLARDQIYFTAKDHQQSTELYSLSDIKGVRKETGKLDEKYLEGDFGAIPDIVWS